MTPVPLLQGFRSCLENPFLMTFLSRECKSSWMLRKTGIQHLLKSGPTIQHITLRRWPEVICLAIVYRDGSKGLELKTGTVNRHWSKPFATCRH